MEDFKVKGQKTKGGRVLPSRLSSIRDARVLALFRLDDYHLQGGAHVGMEFYRGGKLSQVLDRLCQHDLFAFYSPSRCLQLFGQLHVGDRPEQFPLFSGLILGSGARVSASDPRGQPPHLLNPPVMPEDDGASEVTVGIEATL